MSLSRVAKGDRVQIRPGFELQPGKAECIDVIEAGEVPDAEKIKMYYGPNAPRAAYGAIKVRRVVLRREGPRLMFAVCPCSFINEMSVEKL